MAGDVFAVLDELGLASAHIVGQSLGGMIAQVMAITQPERMRSMTLFYTAPAASDRYRSHDIAAMLAQHQSAPVETTREQAIEDMVTGQRFSSSPAYAFEEAWIRELAGYRFDRCHCPDGPLRQYTAAARAPDRLQALESVETPTAIIHGRADRLIKFEASLDMAKAIKNAELHIFPGLGHEIARPLWPEFLRIITRTAERAV
jgi:pimeloyl-ACP methyl ester carboxylesterase